MLLYCIAYGDATQIESWLYRYEDTGIKLLDEQKGTIYVQSTPQHF